MVLERPIPATLAHTGVEVHRLTGAGRHGTFTGTLLVLPANDPLYRQAAESQAAAASFKKRTRKVLAALPPAQALAELCFRIATNLLFVQQPRPALQRLDDDTYLLPPMPVAVFHAFRAFLEAILRHPANPAAHTTALATLRRTTRSFRRDVSAEGLLRAADAMGLPFRYLSSKRNLWALGEGRSVTTLALTLTSRTPFQAVRLVENKPRTNATLRAYGLPAPDQTIVTTEAAAVEAAEALGYPVVVKPAHGQKGKGVSAHLTSARAVRRAFATAAAMYSSVIVERHVMGTDHRLLVAHGRLIAAARRHPPTVVGNGTASVKDLIDLDNVGPRRSGPHAALYKIQITDDTAAVLATQGLSLESVPAAGRVVQVRSVANLSQGGVSEDLTDRIHPDNAAMAVRAVLLTGMDVAGVDFLCPDLSRSFREVGGGICEINSLPGLRVHMASAPANPYDHPVTTRLLRALCEVRPPRRLPRTVVLTGGGDADPVAEAVSRTIMPVERHGPAGRHGLVHGARYHVPGMADWMTMANPDQAFDRLVLCPYVHSCILFWPRDDFLAHGLPMAEADLVAVAETMVDDPIEAGLAGVAAAGITVRRFADAADLATSLVALLSVQDMAEAP